MEEEKKAVDEDSDDSPTPDEGDQEEETKEKAILEGRKILHSLLTSRLEMEDDDLSSHEESFGFIEASIAQIEANINSCLQSPDPKFQRFRFSTPSSTPPCTPPVTPVKSPVSKSAILTVPVSPCLDPLPPPKPPPPPAHSQPLFTLLQYFLPSDFFLLPLAVGVVSMVSLQGGVALFSFLCILTVLLQLNQDVLYNSPEDCSLLYEHFHKLVCKMFYPVHWLSTHRLSLASTEGRNQQAGEAMVLEEEGPMEVPEAPPLDLNPIIKITPPEAEPSDAVEAISAEPFIPEPGVPEAPEGPPGPPGPPGGPGMPFGVEDPVAKYGLPPIKICPFQLKMKAVHWAVLAPAKVKGTIWEELAVQQAETDETQNFDHFEKCFQEKKVEVKLKLKEPDKRIRFLEHKRSNMIEIALSSFPASIPALLEAILSMNEEVIIPDRLTRLVEMLPTEKEKGPLKTHANTPKEQLGDAEAFLVQLAAIPHLDIRLSTHLCITQFRERCVFLEVSLENVASALDELRSSENLRKVLADVLNFGNHMNSSNSKGPDYGFGLEFLDKLVITKSTDRSMNLLHYIIEHLRGVSGQKMITSAAGQKPQSFLADMPHLAAAARVECSCVLTELKTMKKEFDMIGRALMLIAPPEGDAAIADPLPAEWRAMDKFGLKVKRFYCDGLVSYRRLTSRLRTCCAAAEELAVYFGSFQPDQLVQRRSEPTEHVGGPRRLKDRDDLDLDLYGWNGLLGLFKSFHDAFCKAEVELEEIHRARARKEKQPPKIKKTLQPPSEAAAALASLIRATTPRAS